MGNNRPEVIHPRCSNVQRIPNRSLNMTPFATVDKRPYMRTDTMQDMECPLCGSERFKDFGKRKQVKCDKYGFDALLSGSAYASWAWERHQKAWSV